MSKNIGIALIVIAIIAIGGYLFPSVQGSVIERIVGSVAGPDLQSSYWSVDGVTHEYRRTELAKATTTPCALKSPAATSTLLAATLQVTTASSTATTWTLATSTTAFATTSPLTAAFSLGSGALGSMQFTGTTTINGVAFEGVNTADILPPSSYIVWGRAGTAESDTTKLNGVCQAEFLVF